MFPDALAQQVQRRKGEQKGKKQMQEGKVHHTQAEVGNEMAGPGKLAAPLATPPREEQPGA